MTRRQELLRATQEAARVLSQFHVEARPSFDVMGAAIALGIPVLFRPLQGLWGAAITVGKTYRGVIVTSKLGLHVQRFTLAHELGHILLGHRISLDEFVGFQGRSPAKGNSTQEVAANLFASELLAAPSLMRAVARRHAWNRTSLSDPLNVYQMSLRLGLSFEATCVALADRKAISRDLAQAHLDDGVRNLKVTLASDVDITNSWADVWSITQADSGAVLEATPDDLFAIRLEENSSAGFLWELIDSGHFGTVVSEQRAVGETYGQVSQKTVFMRFTKPGSHRLLFEHRRPWNRQTIAHIDVSITNYGKEDVGLARRWRETTLAAASA